MKSLYCKKKKKICGLKRLILHCRRRVYKEPHHSNCPFCQNQKNKKYLGEIKPQISIKIEVGEAKSVARGRKRGREEEAAK